MTLMLAVSPARTSQRSMLQLQLSMAMSQTRKWRMSHRMKRRHSQISMMGKASCVRSHELLELAGAAAQEATPSQALGQQPRAQ